MTTATNSVTWPSFNAGEDPVEALVKLSRFYGMDPAFVLAGGGNTSVKVGDRLYVKSSGVALARIERAGFVILDRQQLDTLANADFGTDVEQREAQYKTAIMNARIAEGTEFGGRPSVESLLHHLVPAKFVVHTHATMVNALTCSVQGEKLAQKIFGDEVLWLEFVDPGYTLGRYLKEKLEKYVGQHQRGPKAILMANHGLIVSGDTPEEVRANTDFVIAQLQTQLGAGWKTLAWQGAAIEVAAGSTRDIINVVGPALRGLMAEAGNSPLKVTLFDDSELVKAFVCSSAGKKAALGGPLNPDQIVYCTSFALWFEPKEKETAPELVARLQAALVAHKKSHKYEPRVVLVAGVGLFAVGDDYKSTDTARQLYLDTIQVMAGALALAANGGGGILYLADAKREFIENWEVEAYRRQIAKQGAKAGRVSGKIAIVTGAAQGFGLEIAQHFIAEGGTAVLTDINLAGVEKAAAELNARYGVGRALGLAINVTSGDSIAACVEGVVRQFGGCDVLISNAGVLKAESVKTQSEKDFDFVTAVNYKGYFFCVQKVSAVLAMQHLAKPEYLSDIIQINSKSGLVGSNKNGAYAGSKFGGIGLTQSFALELITDGVKVNSICPGNFFDGPLWSDPQNGLFVQYLRTGKVPGAKTLADVKKFYESKVPMGRGCMTADVMKAIYYLIDQAYETGQAVPVTGGQVMLA